MNERALCQRDREEEGSGRQEDRQTRENTPFSLQIQTLDRLTRNISAVATECSCSAGKASLCHFKAPISITVHSYKISMLHVVTLSPTNELHTRAELLLYKLLSTCVLWIHSFSINCFSNSTQSYLCPTTTL